MHPCSSRNSQGIRRIGKASMGSVTTVFAESCSQIWIDNFLVIEVGLSLFNRKTDRQALVFKSPMVGLHDARSAHVHIEPSESVRLSYRLPPQDEIRGLRLSTTKNHLQKLEKERQEGIQYSDSRGRLTLLRLRRDAYTGPVPIVFQRRKFGHFRQLLALTGG